MRRLWSLWSMSLSNLLPLLLWCTRGGCCWCGVASRRQLSWQFPAGKVEPEESREAAAVREAQEETGMRVIARELLGERVHPANGQLMSYTACDVLSDTAHGARRG